MSNADNIHASLGDEKFLVVSAHAIKATMARYRTMLEVGYYADLDSDGDLQIAYSPLTERETQVVSLRMGVVDGKKWTLGEVGTLMGIMRERVRQIELKSLRKMSNSLASIGRDGNLGESKESRRAYDARMERELRLDKKV